MIFEIKINYVNLTKSGIDIKASIYRTSAPIVAEGSTHYDRTLLYSDTRTIPLGTTKLQIINALKAKMTQYNDANGTEFVPSDFYVNIQNIKIS